MALTVPSALSLTRTTEPPPSPMDSTSGMRKFVRTPPMFTATPLSRGKPFDRMPKSVVVPPTSMTMASSTPVR